MILRRIREGELGVGQPLPWPLYSQKGTLLFTEGSGIESADALEGLLELGLYMQADLTWHQTPETPLQMVLHAVRRMEALLQSANKETDFAAEVTAVADMLSTAYHRNPDVVIATVILQRGGSYVVRHAVNTACVAAAVLQAMHMNEADTRSVLAAALTMNICLQGWDEAAVVDSADFTPLQDVRHPVTGMEKLRELGVVDDLWLRAVLEHHEMIDGSGYPCGLYGSRVAQASQLIGLADLFCARVDERAHRQMDDTHLVLRDVLIERGRHFDATLGAYFIRALGVYPIGSLVLLANGEVAVVSNRTDRVDAPWVHALRSPDGSNYQPPIRRQTQPIETSIVDTLSGKALLGSIDMADIWGEDAFDFPLKPLLMAYRQPAAITT
ncbi:HD-GYP domain-containing protein [Chitinimonas sp. PSY-7]|uniref:HD domain-containing phosphohydrolase n=1 Tax=Chitinimonas sp. PSY-7 TaxID=3459088 RepID=UPI00404022B8